VPRAAIYARISLDRKEGAGVGRQVADCRKLAAERGLEVAGEYVDNDLSAFRSKRRPQWDRLLDDVAGGRVDVVLAYHPDRLYRRLVDLERFADVVRQAGADVFTVKAGRMDLSTASGRMIAGIIGSVARGESERMGERVARERLARAVAGKPSAGGVRPFGYEADKVTLRPAEADLIRQAAADVAAGGSMHAVVAAWNEAGVATSAGNRWDVVSLRRVLTSPRIAGLRVHRGEVVGEAAWEPIIDRPTHELLKALALSRKLGPRRESTWLLSAMIACPRCGRPLYGSARGGYRAYVCAPASGRGCGRASVSAGPCEAKVIAEVERIIAVAAGRVVKRLKAPKASTEAGAITERMRDLAERWGAGDITTAEFDAARAALAARQEALEEQVAEVRPMVPPARLLDLWRAGTVPERRTVIEAVIELPMTLSTERMDHPADRLTVVKRA
jgi:DNA invertase Pin-like site-specific DNA recombinase